MSKICVNGIEIETERYIEEGYKQLTQNLDKDIQLMDNIDIPTEFSKFFVRNEGDLLA